jgi:hypothetical protein
VRLYNVLIIVIFIQAFKILEDGRVTNCIFQGQGSDDTYILNGCFCLYLNDLHSYLMLLLAVGSGIIVGHQTRHFSYKFLVARVELRPLPYYCKVCVHTK